MPTENMSMRNVMGIVRQRWLLGRAHRAMAESMGVSVGAVSGALLRKRLRRP